MQYYVLIGNKQEGPFTKELVQGKLLSGEFNAALLGWHKGLSDWKPLSQIFAEFIHSEQSDEPSSKAPVIPPMLPQVIALAPPQIPQVMSQDSAKISKTEMHWFDYSLVIFPALLCCFPLGLVPLWLTKRFEKSTKISLTAIGVFYFAVASMLQIAKNASKQREEENTTTRTDSKPQSSGATFDFTAPNFRNAFNLRSKQVSTLAGLHIDNFEVTTVSPDAEYAFYAGRVSEKINVMLTVKKSSGLIDHIGFVCEADNVTESHKLLTVPIVAIATLDPTISPTERGEIVMDAFDRCKADGKSSSVVSRGCFQFEITRSEALGFVFSFSPKGY